jgi:elongation factor 2
MPATRRAILGAMLSANPRLRARPWDEVKGPADRIGAITGIISGKRGKLVNIEQREVLTIVEGEIPAAETLDLSEKMRAATAGRAVWNTYFKLWQAVPTDEHAPVLAEQVRKRKGLPIEPPKASEFIDDE